MELTWREGRITCLALEPDGELLSLPLLALLLLLVSYEQRPSLLLLQPLRPLLLLLKPHLLPSQRRTLAFNGPGCASCGNIPVHTTAHIHPVLVPAGQRCWVGNGQGHIEVLNLQARKFCGAIKGMAGGWSGLGWAGLGWAGVSFAWLCCAVLAGCGDLAGTLGWAAHGVIVAVGLKAAKQALPSADL